MKRIKIFVGNYGSGKTEISLNTAYKLADEGKKVILADIDIVNPYFRSSEKTQELNAKGIKVLAPPGANSNVDLPSLPMDIYTIFESDAEVIIDCGGDPAGATALGALRHKIEAAKDEVDIFFVSNVRRPLQSSVEEVEEMLDSIEYVSRLKVNGIINNTNLAYETKAEDLLFGKEILEQVAKNRNVPIAYTCGMENIIKEYEEKTGDKNTIIISINMRPYWQEVEEN